MIVKTRCEVIFNPNTEVPEVIRVTEPSEELVVVPKLRRRRTRENPEFVPVIQDGDVRMLGGTVLNQMSNDIVQILEVGEVLRGAVFQDVVGEFGLVVFWEQAS